MTTEENTIAKANKGNSAGNKGKRVMCVETGEIFNTATEAAKHFGITSTSLVCAVCRGVHRTTKGKTFRYIDEHGNILAVPEVPVVEREITIQRKAVIRGKGKSCNGNTNAVLCISTGEILTSCHDAANHADVTPGHMSSVCRGNVRTAKGKRYCYVKDITEHLDEVAESIRKANMYDEFTTKKERHQQLLTILSDAESKVSIIEDNIQRLHEQLKQAHLEVEKAKSDLINFEW